MEDNRQIYGYMHIRQICRHIANREKWLARPVNIKEANKQVKQAEKCWKILDPAYILFYAQRLCMNYIIAMLQAMIFHWLVARGIHNHLLHFARFCADSTPRTANKNIQQRTLPIFCHHLSKAVFMSVDSIMK